jgi:hypothetical protein
VRHTLVLRVELTSAQDPPRISLREDSEGAVAYVSLSFPNGKVSLCIRHPRQAMQLQEALARAIAELQEVASFTA